MRCFASPARRFGGPRDEADRWGAPAATLDGMTADTPLLQAPTLTFVIEKGGPQLARYQGALVLPVGSRIEFNNRAAPDGKRVPLDDERFPTGNADAVVVGIRLWGAQANPTLVLDVELVAPGAWPTLD